MNKLPIHPVVICLGLALSSVACHPTRHLAEGELLYQGTEIEFVGTPPTRQKNIATNLSFMARPKPNTKLLGGYPWVGIYNAFANKEKGIGKWIRDKIGQAPVIYDAELGERSRLKMEKYLKDDGYLQASVRQDTLVQNQKVTASYKISAGALFTLGKVDWPADTTPLQTLIAQQKARSLLKTGMPYQLSKLKEERIRLAQAGLEQGFFGLSSDNFYYFLDTAYAQHQVGLYLRVAPPQDGRPLRPHYIGHTTVYSTYLLDEQEAGINMDTLTNEAFRFIQSQDFVRLPVLTEAILQDKNERYVYSLQQKTVNRLLGLGPYKFVNLKYRLRQEQDSLFLDRQLYLTPSLTQDFSAELEASSLESNSLGSALNINYTHRNFMGGAENFSLNLSTGVQTQIGSGVSFINSFDVALEGRLSFPHLFIPFKLFRTDQSWQARSTIALGGEYERRATQYTLQSFRGKFSYQWQPGSLQQHEFSPLQLTWVNTSNTSQSFEERLAANPRLRANFSNYLIASATYQYFYSEEVPQQRKDYFSFLGRAETAGNLAYGLSSLLGAKQEKPHKFFGVPFAQFLRLEADARFHNYLSKGSWIVRTNIGVALPYGNAEAIPYIRQFFVGGSNSIRAFNFRELGPGSVTSGFSPAQGVSDQTGDIKLELNAEYRFPLFSYLRGAVFLDAGNVWLTGQSPAGSEATEGFFEWDNFYKEIAVGTGFGLRLDIVYFILRLDIAFPLRRPFEEGGFRWVVDEIAFGASSWRQDNLVFNLALGYPF